MKIFSKGISLVNWIWNFYAFPNINTFSFLMLMVKFKDISYETTSPERYKFSSVKLHKLYSIHHTAISRAMPLSNYSIYIQNTSIIFGIKKVIKTFITPIWQPVAFYIYNKKLYLSLSHFRYVKIFTSKLPEAEILQESTGNIKSTNS